MQNKVLKNRNQKQKTKQSFQKHTFIKQNKASNIGT